MTTIPDRIEKKLLLRATKARVWRALSDSKEFGAWFGVNLEGPFVPGAAVSGKITTKGYEHLTMIVIVEKVERERLLSFRWHPYAIDSKVDYSKEPTTLVEFQLEEGKDGTMLTVIESGFDQIPLARRAEAYKSNDGGWAAQMENIERHVAKG
ncbi:MAG: SRPBCC family protein [Polyangiaceae bacterium]